MERLRKNKKRATQIILIAVAILVAALYKLGVVSIGAAQSPVPEESRWIVNTAIAAVLLIAGYLLAEINKKDKK